MIDLKNNILILTGPPGAGKTTLAKELAATQGSPSVHLHTDDFWHFIKKGTGMNPNEMLTAVKKALASGSFQIKGEV